MVRLIQEGRLGLAPVRNARNVIDVCTGTGIWATDYGMFATSLSFCLTFFVLKDLLCLAFYRLYAKDCCLTLLFVFVSFEPTSTDRMSRFLFTKLPRIPNAM